MNSDQRVADLERRVAVLETLLRRLAGDPVDRGSPRDRVDPTDASSIPISQPRPSGSAVAAYARPRPEPPSSVPISPRAAPPHRLDGEQWLGQRAFLGLGVALLVLAAGYFLKLAFDRGWISPFLRCLGGASAGFVVGAMGWRLEARGMRRYGGALIGAGAAIVYLSVWAATKLYAFLPPPGGIAALCCVSLALAGIALAIDVEWLCGVAALGAFFAPVLLGSAQSNATSLLIYLGAMGLALGFVSTRKRWRGATFLIALSYFAVVPTGAIDSATPLALVLYGSGGSAGLFYGLREGWWETRFLAFGGGWSVLHLAHRQSHEEAGWLIPIGALALAMPVWWREWRNTAFGGNDGERMRPINLREGLYFLVTPVLLVWAVEAGFSTWFAAHEGAAPLMVAVAYLAVGYGQYRSSFALIGTIAVSFATLLHWPGLTATWVFAGLTVLWSALDHPLERWDGRWYALMTLFAGVVHLWLGDLDLHGGTDAAFVGPWALAFWGTVAITAGLAAGLWRRTPTTGASTFVHRVPALLWGVAGLLLFLGVTGEIGRYFDQSGLPQLTASLARGLAVSAWWALFAGSLVLLGFRRNLKLVRVAGLAVAGMAAFKVVAFDLSSLEALYRVGSVLMLGLVSLGVAYLYNRKAQSL